MVDDDTDAANTMALVVRDGGHEVVVAHVGSAALAMAEKFGPGNALVDSGLAAMDGYGWL